MYIKLFIHIYILLGLFTLFLSTVDNPFLASVIRLLRFICFVITISGQVLYVAVETFHQEMMPTQHVITRASSQEGVTFPAIVQTILIITAFEVLRESGVRLPR
jgi:spore germination protein KA